MTFVIQVRDWLIRGVLEGINQSRARIIKDITYNSEKFYIIYLLRIINIQISLLTLKRLDISINLLLFFQTYPSKITIICDT